MGWPQGRLPRGVDIGAPQQGLEPMLGRREIAQGIFSELPLGGAKAPQYRRRKVYGDGDLTVYPE